MCEVQEKIVKNVRAGFEKEFKYLVKTGVKTESEAQYMQAELASLPDSSIYRLYNILNSVTMRD